MARVGTLAWAAETGGALRLRDRLDLLVRQAPPELGRQLVEWLGWPRPLRHDDWQQVVRDIEIPATPEARRAEELCRRVAEPWLLDHCFRVFAFGLLLGGPLGEVVPETLFAMAMLHDLGLTREYRRQPGELDAPCFAVRGARAAQEVADDDVAEAVALHLNVRVPRRRLEAHLLQAGTNLDVAGIRHRRLPPEAIDAVTTRWPRGPWRWEAWRALAAEASGQPEYCRARFLARWGLLRWRIARAPFPH